MNAFYLSPNFRRKWSISTVLTFFTSTLGTIRKYSLSLKKSKNYLETTSPWYRNESTWDSHSREATTNKNFGPDGAAPKATSYFPEIGPSTTTLSTITCSLKNAYWPSPSRPLSYFSCPVTVQSLTCAYASPGSSLQVSPIYCSCITTNQWNISSILIKSDQQECCRELRQDP